MSKLLIVVDYQNDFVAGALGFEAARALEDPIADMVKQAIFNKIAFLEIHKKFANLKLSPEDFLKLRFVDEIFASSKEQIIAQNPTSQEDMKQIVSHTQQNWLKDENKKHYYQDEGSDFAAQLDQYNSITKNRKIDNKHLMFNELLEAYTSFEKGGKIYHLSSAINFDFNMPERLKKYAGIETYLPFSKNSLER